MLTLLLGILLPGFAHGGHDNLHSAMDSSIRDSRSYQKQNCTMGISLEPLLIFMSFFE